LKQQRSLLRQKIKATNYRFFPYKIKEGKDFPLHLEKMKKERHDKKARKIQ
jgi:hypothetical protein